MVAQVQERGALGHAYGPRHAGRSSASHANEYFAYDSLDAHVANVRRGQGGYSGQHEQAVGRMEAYSKQAAMPAVQPPPMRLWQKREMANELQSAKQAHGVGLGVAGEAQPFRLWQQKRADQVHEHRMHRMQDAGVVRAPWE